MDKTSARMHGRKEFRVLVTSVPVLLVGADERWAVVMINEGDGDVYIGGAPGSTTGTWMLLPADQGFTDNYTSDPWYARTTSATVSGTVSGWYI